MDAKIKKTVLNRLLLTWQFNVRTPSCRTWSGIQLFLDSCLHRNDNI